MAGGQPGGMVTGQVDTCIIASLPKTMGYSVEPNTIGTVRNVLMRAIQKCNFY